MIRQFLGVLDESHLLAGVEFLHEIVEVFGVLLHHDGVHCHPRDIPVLPPELVGVRQHQVGVLNPVPLALVNLPENIRGCPKNIFFILQKKHIRILPGVVQGRVEAIGGVRTETDPD